jgi:hypothetical protein
MDRTPEAGALCGTTGETCRASGAYRCDACGVQTISVAKGERFPACTRDRTAVNWALIRTA